MVGVVPQYQLDAIARDYLPNELRFKYPCGHAKSKDTCDITIEVTDSPKDTKGNRFYPTGNYPIYMKIGNTDRKFLNPIALTNSLNNTYLPRGTYHLEYVSCSCPSFVREIRHKIQSLFREKVFQKNCCRVHTKEFNVYLRSNQKLSSILKKK